MLQDNSNPISTSTPKEKDTSQILTWRITYNNLPHACIYITTIFSETTINNLTNATKTTHDFGYLSPFQNRYINNDESIQKLHTHNGFLTVGIHNHSCGHNKTRPRLGSHLCWYCLAWHRYEVNDLNNMGFNPLAWVLGILCSRLTTWTILNGHCGLDTCSRTDPHFLMLCRHIAGPSFPFHMHNAEGKLNWSCWNIWICKHQFIQMKTTEQKQQNMYALSRTHSLV